MLGRRIPSKAAEDRKSRPKVKPESGVVSGSAALSKNVTLIGPPFTVSLPTLGTVVPPGYLVPMKNRLSNSLTIRAELGPKYAAEKMVTGNAGGKKFSGSFQAGATLGRVNTTWLGNVTFQSSREWCVTVTVIPDVDPLYVTVKLVREFSVITMSLIGTAHTGCASRAIAIPASVRVKNRKLQWGGFTGTFHLYQKAEPRQAILRATTVWDF